MLHKLLKQHHTELYFSKVSQASRKQHNQKCVCSNKANYCIYAIVCFSIGMDANIVKHKFMVHIYYIFVLAICVFIYAECTGISNASSC